MGIEMKSKRISLLVTLGSFFAAGLIANAWSLNTCQDDSCEFSFNVQCTGGPSGSLTCPKSATEWYVNENGSSDIYCDIDGDRTLAGHLQLNQSTNRSFSSDENARVQPRGEKTIRA